MENKMASAPVGKLILKMGLPMIISMVLQAVYNIVDTAFVINCGADGADGNLALTYAFPIQLLIIAVGVGTGVGLNATLSKSLGAKDGERANKVVGNGIFLGLCIYVVFLLFGIFGAEKFIEMQAHGNPKAAEMGTEYLKICCCASFGAIGFTIYERFLQSTGKTMLSTIAQISGAAANIVLDYVFIYPLNMGVRGAAWATVIGQVLSLAVAVVFHYLMNDELHGRLKDIKPDIKIIGEIYHIGLSAALMQGMLSVMTLGVNLILGTAENARLLQGSFGVYYKIMQFALFACFGLSNTIISALSYNYGKGDVKRSRQCVLWGIAHTLAVSAIIWGLFECAALPLAGLFGMTEQNGAEIEEVVVCAIRFASCGYVFMGFIVAVQGVLQALGYAAAPLAIAVLRLAVFTFPAVWIFTIAGNAQYTLWWAFPISELLTAVVSTLLLRHALRQKLGVIQPAACAAAVT